jgi:hypothetical protein
LKNHIRTRERRLTAIALSFFGCLIFASWVLASPPGSGADDQYHLPSIWCSEESLSNGCITEGGNFKVSANLTRDKLMCWVYTTQFDSRRETNNALCSKPVANDPVSPISFLNQKAKYYPSFFYTVSSKFVSSNFEISIITIRMFWAIVFMAFSIYSFLLLPKNILSGFVLTLTLFAAPLIMFLVPSTNPSGASVIGVLFFSLLLAAWYQEKDKKRSYGHLLAMVISVVISCGSRPDNFIFILLVYFFTSIVYRPNLKKSLIPIPFILLLPIVFENISALRNSMQAGFTSPKSLFPLNWTVLNENLLLLPKYFAGLWGYYEGLGWKWEPPMNGMLAIIQLIFCVTLIFTGILKNEKKSERLLFSIYGLVVLAIPLYIAQRISTNFGSMVQPRYMLPLSVAFAVLVFIRNSKLYFEINLRTLKYLFTLSVLSNTYAIHTQLNRVVNGNSSGNLNLIQNESWWWSDLFVTPTTVIFTSVVASACLALLGFRYLQLNKQALTSEPTQSKRKNAR